MMSEGDVPDSVRSVTERVAVVLTQSWCPDWLAMRRYLETLDEPELTVFYLEYDRSPLFHELMAFKETVFGNDLIPYVRYYRAGTLVAESNRVFMKRRFLKKFERQG